MDQDSLTVSRLAEALIQASRTDEYKVALAASNASDETSDARFRAWQTLAKIALRDGRSSLAFVKDIPVHRIPGFREANDDLEAAIGKVIVLRIDAGTGKVDSVSLEPAEKYRIEISDSEA